MSTVVVSHGLGARNDSVWFPYLTEQLAALGHRVIVPNLPEPTAPQRGTWTQALAKAVAEAGSAEEIVLVGHSIGSVNVLRMLEKHDPATEGRFAGAVLVSTSAFEVGYDPLASFFDAPFQWSRIRAAASDFRLLSAIDDPVNAADPMEHIAQLVRGLGATAVVKPTGEHLGNFAEDHIELPEAVELITAVFAERRSSRPPSGILYGTVKWTRFSACASSSRSRQREASARRRSGSTSVCRRYRGLSSNWKRN